MICYIRGKEVWKGILKDKKKNETTYNLRSYPSCGKLDP
jgi:hypothetical protein